MADQDKSLSDDALGEITETEALESWTLNCTVVSEERELTTSALCWSYSNWKKVWFT